MIKDADECLACFKNLISTSWSNLSESDTRSKIIDPLFKDCLNWDEGDITREEYKHPGYIDYIFKQEGRIQFILEAKKEGVTFKIPDNWKSRKYKINATISQCKELINAMEQVHRYCADLGVTVGIVTNGYQYVIFEACKIGSSWRNGRCVIFNGHEDIHTNFVDFYQALNKTSVWKGSLYILLSEKISTLKFARPLEKITNRDATLTRNYLHKYVTPFVNYIFKDITDSSQLDILKNCYVYQKTDRNTNDEIKQLFIDRIPHYAKDEQIKYFIEKEKSAGWFQDCVNYVRKTSKTGAVILLLGGVGSGKTTFIHRFYNVILEEELKNTWFYVDFRTAPLSKEQLDQYIYENIIDDLERNYLNTVRSSIESFNIVWDNTKKEEYVENLFTTLRLSGYSVSLVLDNVDRCDVRLQEDIFREAHHLAQKFSILILVSLREESFFRSKLTGVFDAYYNDRFHISAPQFEQLILVRINYLLDLLEKDDKELSKIIGGTINFDGKKDEVRKFFQILAHSLARFHKHFLAPITYFVTSISEGNMRIALDMFNNFLLSGNTKVKEMIDVERKGEQYTIAPYQFLKSVILNDAKYYQEEHSEIMNLFDVNTDLTDSQFLNLRVLNYSYINRYNESSLERGYVSINKLVQEAEDILMSRASIEDALKKLAKYKLIRFDNETNNDLRGASYYKITATGYYYLTTLLSKFIYLDLIQGDTPISDANVVSILCRHIDAEKLDERFKRTWSFVNYLKEKEDAEFIEHPEYQGSPLTNVRFLPRIQEKLKKEQNIIFTKPKNIFLTDDTITLGNLFSSDKI